VAQAGRKGGVTVSTNMAGRGTDILLGGNPEFMAREAMRKKGVNPDLMPPQEWQAILNEFKTQTDSEHEEVVGLGGLHILGTERHESRRIDNQLRGRAGRQGDPGSSRFYLSLQDDLLRIFGGEKVQNLMLRLGMEEDVPIESKLITRRIEAAQKAVEAQNFEARKHLIEYDDVMNKQRESVYGKRRKLLEGTDQKDNILDLIGDLVGDFVEIRCPERSHPDTYDLAGLRVDVANQFATNIDSLAIEGAGRQEIADEITDYLARKYKEKEQQIGAERLRYYERMIMLQFLDSQWKDHLLSMDHLKEGISLRSYGQKDPLVEYKKESFKLFQAMMARFEEETIRFLFILQPGVAPSAQQPPAVLAPDNGEGEAPEPEPVAVGVAAGDSLEDFTRDVRRKKQRELAQVQMAGAGDTKGEVKQVIRGEKVGRNDPCPCGSGKKYKKCCGQGA
jgi:preprotein translocase subunit SecA